MKKVISLILCLCMIMAVSPTLMVFADATTVAEALTQTNYKYLSLANGANSKMYLTYPGTDSSYKPFVDYYGYGGSGITDNTAYPATALYLPGTSEITNLGSFLYLNNGIWSVYNFVYLPTDTATNDNVAPTADSPANWTSELIPYNIDPNGKVVKTAKYGSSALTSACPALADKLPSEISALNSEIMSMNNVMVDVENGYYGELNMLSSSAANKVNALTVTIHYADGTTEPHTLHSVMTTYKYTQDYGHKKLKPVTGHNLSDATPFTNAYGTSRKIIVGKQNVKVDKVEFNTNVTWVPTNVMGLTAKTASVLQLITALPQSVTPSNIDSVKDLVSGIETQLSQAGYTIADLNTEDADKIMALKSQVNSQIINKTSLIPLDLNAGNSKLYIANSEISASNTNYMPYLDYKSFGTNTIQAGANIASETAGIVKETITPKLGNGIWNVTELDDLTVFDKKYDINETVSTARIIPYKIDTAKKAIKLATWSDTTNVSAANGYTADEIKAAMAGMNNVTSDIGNGFYNQINFLACTNVTGSLISTNKVIVHLIYKDGTEEAKTVQINGKPYSTSGTETASSGKTYFECNAKPQYGYMFAQNVCSGANNGTVFVSYAVDTAVDKEVNKIKFEKSGGNSITIAAVTAQSASLASLINALPVTVNASNVDNVSGLLGKIDSMAQTEGVDLQNLDSSYTAKINTARESYDNFSSNAFYARDISYNSTTGLVSVTFDNYTTSAQSAIIAAANYNNHELIDVKTFSVSVDPQQTNVVKTATYTPVENSTVKVFVWNNLSDLLPLINNYEYTPTLTFVGDSITHAGYYPTYVETYCQTRFPNSVINFANAGIAGNTAASAISRYDWDIMQTNPGDVTIMFGMNDGNRTIYPGGNADAKTSAINSAKANLETLIQKFIADGVNVTLITPSIYDERAYSGATETNYTGYNGALAIMADNIKALGTKYGLNVIDIYTATNTITNSFSSSGISELIGADRVHLNRIGHFVMAYEFIKSKFAGSDTVSDVNFNVATGTSSALNANITNASISANGVSYTYAPKSLPMPTDSYYNDAESKYISFTNELNKELVKVSGLSEGNYSINFGSTVIGTFSNTDLEEGVNIAALDTNPGQVQAKQVLAINNNKYTYVNNLRNLQYAISILKSAGQYDGKTAGEINAYIVQIYPSSDTGYTATVMRQYNDLCTNKSSYIESVNTLTTQARDAAQPLVYNVTIQKI